MNALLIVCAIQTIAIMFLAYLYQKTVADMSAKLMARDLYEVKSFQQAPEKVNPADEIPKSDEVLAIEWELENKRRIELLKKEAVRTGEEMLAKTWDV